MAGALLLVGCGSSSDRGVCEPRAHAESPDTRQVPAAGTAPVAPPERTDHRDAPGSDFGNVQASSARAAGLDYLEVVVGDVPADVPMPLIIGIHGLGDRPRMPYPPYVGLPVPVRIVAPRAPEPYGDGFTWLPVRVRDGEMERLARALDDRASELTRFVEALRERYRVQGDPIVTGFSQGGMLTYALAVHHPEAVGAAFPLAGWLPPPLWPDARDPDAPNPPIRAMHGGADLVIPPGPTVEAVRALDALGYDIALEQFEGVGHHMTADMNRLMGRWLADAVERAGDSPP